MAIYLIRHGQTDSNKNKVLQLPNAELSEQGQQQAQLVAQAFADIAISKIICSDQIRAQQTAEPLAQLKQCQVVLEPKLQERNFGDLRGQAYAQLPSDIFNANFTPANGESQSNFAKRVALVWQTITEQYAHQQENCVVITHGLVLRQLITAHLTLPADVPFLSEYHNGCIIEIASFDGRTIKRCCDIRHLQQVQHNQTIV